MKLKRKTIVLGILSFILWFILYQMLSPCASWLTYSILGLKEGSRLGESIEFFLFDTPKLLLLLTFFVFIVGVIQSFFTPERTRKILADKSKWIGNILAALLGTVTPFCSCSAVPLFIGFVTAGIPLGVTFSFLVSAPMVNEVALVLLYGLFGWKVAGLYLGTGLLIAIYSGWIIGRLKLESYVEPWVYEINTSSQKEENISEQLTWEMRINVGKNAVRGILGKVWPYIIGGIAVGACIHGYVPEDFMVTIMGKQAWWSVPLSVIIGIPMYSNAVGIIPIVQVLLEKGAALGTVLAFMMSVVALSLPEMMILRKVLKPTLIAIFVLIVGTGILLMGYLFNGLL